MWEKTLFIVAIGLKKLSADGHLWGVVNVWTHSAVALVALAKLVEEHAVLLTARLWLDNRVDAPVLVRRDALTRHRVPASNQNPRLVFYVLLAVKVKLSRDDLSCDRFLGAFVCDGFRRVGGFWFDAVELSTTVRDFVSDPLNIDESRGWSLSNWFWRNRLFVLLVSGVRNHRLLLRKPRRRFRNGRRSRCWWFVFGD